LRSLQREPVSIDIEHARRKKLRHSRIQYKNCPPTVLKGTIAGAFGVDLQRDTLPMSGETNGGVISNARLPQHLGEACTRCTGDR